MTYTGDFHDRLSTAELIDAAIAHDAANPYVLALADRLQAALAALDDLEDERRAARGLPSLAQIRARRAKVIDLRTRAPITQRGTNA